MGKTSSAAKRRYNDKAYDRIFVTVPKGDKDKLKAAADAQGKSLNQYILDCIAAADGKGANTQC